MDLDLKDKIRVVVVSNSILEQLIHHTYMELSSSKIKSFFLKSLNELKLHNRELKAIIESFLGRDFYLNIPSTDRDHKTYHAKQSEKIISDCLNYCLENLDNYIALIESPNLPIALSILIKNRILTLRKNINVLEVLHEYSELC
ncbi:MAG: hypothetical protein CML04_00400 [Pseudozobellia sp.]|nr:hypothetical protein [Pseudozobellia sp.]MBG48018.1 hypothetical protein [Pseudozobellia sp.]|tara:strand:- start:238 stop:669 length:432 start_codon:yes stop_codon:yes gene_type:complete